MNVFFEHLTNEREERDWPVVRRGGGGTINQFHQNYGIQTSLDSLHHSFQC